MKTQKNHQFLPFTYHIKEQGVYYSCIFYENFGKIRKNEFFNMIYVNNDSLRCIKVNDEKDIPDEDFNQNFKLTASAME